MDSAESDSRPVGTIWVFDLDRSIPTIKPAIDVTFSRVGPEFISQLREATGATSTTPILRRFEGGRRCYIAQVENKIAAYGWVSINEEFVGELNLRLRLLPGEAYIWDCATLPAFRRRLLYSALLTHILVDLSTEKLHRVWIGADFDNVVSQRGIARAGFQHVADLILASLPAPRPMWLQRGTDVPESLLEEARRAFLNH